MRTLVETRETIDLWEVARVLARTPATDVTGPVRVRARIFAAPSVLVGAAWLVGSVASPNEWIVRILGLVFFVIGAAVWLATSAPRHFVRIDRILGKIGTFIRVTLSVIAIIATSLGGILAVIAIASAFSLRDGKVASSVTAISLAMLASAFGYLIVVEAASSSQISSDAVRMRRVVWVRRTWVFLQLTAVIAVSSALYVALDASSNLLPPEFDKTAAIASIAVVAVGAVYAWQLRNRQIVVADRRRILDTLPSTVHALRFDAEASRVLIAQLQAMVHPDPLAPRSIAAPALLSHDIVTVIDAVCAVVHRSELPKALRSRADSDDPEYEHVRRFVDAASSDRAELLRSAAVFLEELRLVVLHGSRTPR